MNPALDREMMQRALRLAERGLHTTTPNPRVGCVVAKGNTVVGRGLAREGRRTARRNQCPFERQC